MGKGRVVVTARPLGSPGEWRQSLLISAYGNAQSGGDEEEGDDLEVIQRIVQRGADRGAAWQRAEIQGDLTGGADGDGLSVGLDGEHRGWFVHQVEHRSDLAGDLLHRTEMLVIHYGAPRCQAAASSGVIRSVACPASLNERSASWMLRSAVEMRIWAIVSCARVGACSAGGRPADSRGRARALQWRVAPP